MVMDISDHLCGGLVASEGLEVILRNVPDLEPSSRLELVVSAAIVYGEWAPTESPSTTSSLLCDEVVGVLTPAADSTFEAELSLAKAGVVSALHVTGLAGRSLRLEFSNKDTKFTIRCVHPGLPLDAAGGVIFDLGSLSKADEGHQDFTAAVVGEGGRDRAQELRTLWIKDRVAVNFAAFIVRVVVTSTEAGPVSDPGHDGRVVIHGLVHNVMQRRGTSNGRTFL
jgi:hypothetical protein